MQIIANGKVLTDAKSSIVAMLQTTPTTPPHLYFSSMLNQMMKMETAANNIPTTEIRTDNDPGKIVLLFYSTS